MKRYIAILAVIVSGVISCQKQDIDLSYDQSANDSDQTMLLKSLLAERATKWTVDDLAVPQSSDGWMQISTDKELAFLLEFGSTAGEKFRLMNDLDISQSSIADLLSSEIGVEKFENFEFDGNDKTISGLVLPWAGGLFSRVNNVKIYDLTLSGCTVGSESNVSNLLGSGSLIGSASGDVTVTGVTVNACAVSAPCKVGGFVGAVTDAACTFTNCKVVDTNVKTLYFKGVSGWCGGFVGFVGRSEEVNGSLKVSVTAESCSVSGGKVQAHMESDTRYSGTFLGTLNGYDYNEVFSMNNCTVSTIFEGLDSKASSFVSIFPDRKVGGHKYMEGYVYFDGLNYAVPWDGTTKTQPVLQDGVYKVYTAAELAWFQGKTETTNKILILKDIDLAGHVFEPIYKAFYVDGQKVDGKNAEIRNLKIVRTNCGKTDGGAFIRQASGTTVHQNITFRNADVKSTHDPAKIASDQAGGNAYSATLVSNVSGTSYTMKNVHAYDGRIYGVNKMGGLLGRVVASDSNISDCSVTGYYLENYEVDAPETFTAIGGMISATFYPQGEVGGMIGFIHCNAVVSGCYVYQTDINAYGQSDQYAGAVPGRHVGTVIGDVRTSSNSNAYTVVITDTSSDDDTLTLSKQHNKTLDQFSKAAFIGKCYNVANDDYKGTVSVNGTKVL